MRRPFVGHCHLFVFCPTAALPAGRKTEFDQRRQAVRPAIVFRTVGLKRLLAATAVSRMIAAIFDAGGAPEPVDNRIVPPVM